MKYLATIFALTIFIRGTSQQFPYTFQTWDAKNGLMSNYCNTVAQDEQGYLYVGTNSGLYVFNGSNFRPLTYDGDKIRIGEGNVEDIIIDRYNRLWFASIEYGVGLIDLDEQNRQVAYFNPATHHKSLQDAKVSKLCFDSKGYLWVGTRGNGLFKLDTAKRKFEAVPIENKNSLYNKYIRSLYLHTNDTLFAGLINGLSIINPLTGNTTHVKFHLSNGGKELIPTVRKVMHINQDSFLLATDRGTFWLKLSDQKLSSVYANPRKKIDFTEINSNDIIKISEKEFWIATENDGVLFYDRSTHKFNFSYLLNTSISGIPKTFVNRFFKDKGGNIWIAQQSGLSLFQSQHIIFNSFSFSEKAFFSGPFIKNHNNFMCVRSSSVVNINTQTGDIQVRNTDKSEQKNKIPSCAVMYSPDDCMFFYFSGFFTLNLTTLRTKPLPLKKDNIDSTFFKHFRVIQCIPDTINGKKEYLLYTVTAVRKMLLNYNPDDGSLTEFIPDVIKGDSEFGYTRIIKVGNGKYWISTSTNGLIYADKKGNSIRYSADEQDVARKIPPGEINDFIVTNQSDIWLLINKTGLVHASLNRDKISDLEIFSEEHGLTDKRLYNIIADKNNNLWISTSSALLCFRKTEKEFLRYSVANGLGNIKFNGNETIMDLANNGYIGISDKYSNITWFNPSGHDTLKPGLLLDNIRVNNKFINAKTIAGQLQLSPDQNNISFSHDIIDFDKTTFYKILYRLENFDLGWNAAGENNEQRYVQLPPGNYTFKIKLQYANGQFSPEKSVQFNIATIWYKTWWFKSIAVLLSLGMIYLVIRNYVNRKLYRQKKELELQNAVAVERSRISTELHDDLGSGLSTIRILSQTLNGNGNSNLEKISTHSQELIQKMREIVWALNNENDTLDQLISYTRRQSSIMLENAGISYQYNVPDTIPEIKVTGGNRRHIQLLVKEAIHNIIKHARAEEVLITIAINDHLTITIHDNGIGLPKTFIYASSGNGIRNMKKHTEALQGILTIENHIGTTIRISMPLQGLSHESVI
ncbi:MAG: two-component regulator propeller domain-containing protein [Agriterribacter sp.]